MGIRKALIMVACLTPDLPCLHAQEVDAPKNRFSEIRCTTYESSPRLIATIRFQIIEGEVAPYGSIKVPPSQTFEVAQVGLSGINFRVDWGPTAKNDVWRYALVIGPTNTSYFDFSITDENGRASPRESLKCSQPTAAESL